MKTAALSKLEGGKPRAFPDGLAATGDYVYEVDKDLITEENPYGVGLAVGLILHPHGNEWKIKWMDGSVEMTPKKFLRKCPPIGALLTDGKNCFRLVKHLKKGTRLQILDAVPKNFQAIFDKARKLLQKKAKPVVGVAVVAALASILPRTSPRTSPRKKRQATKSKKKLPQHNADDDKKSDDADWMRCRASTLKPEKIAALQAALAKARLPPHWTARVFEVFAERCLREYSDLQKSKVHANREKVLRAAISQVMEQVRPVVSQPFDGDLTKATAVLMPVLVQVICICTSCSLCSHPLVTNMRLMHSQVFELEEPSPEGDEDRRREQYVNDRIKKQDFSFRDCVEHEALMQYYVQQQMRSGALDTGYPKLREGEKLPDFRHALYECGKSREYRKYLTKPHPELPFLRKACVLAAVDALKDRCMYPVGIKAVDMFNKHPWDNFAQCLYTFYVEYCFREGLSMTSDMSREVLLYIFYGTFTWTYKKKSVSHTRTKPVLFWLQKRVSQGRSRFSQNAEKYFQKFVRLVKQNQWNEFLQDNGLGDPPVEYLAAVEEGLRAYSADIHTMGTHVLRSPAHWKDVSKWRKREAFIAIMRILCGFNSYYKQWDCFSFEDYVFRQQMARTFNIRHYPLSDGNDRLHFGGVLDFEWSEHSFTPKRKRNKNSSGMKTPSKTVGPKQAKTKPKLYDLTKGTFVDW